MRSHGLSGTNWSSHNAYHSDANGNVTALVNSSGVLQASYRYNPYGGLISSSGALASANTMRFSSKPAIFSSSGFWGFYYYGYRFYDPVNQRWLNRDPIEEAGGNNVFQAMGSDPNGRIDPLGLLGLNLLPDEDPLHGLAGRFVALPDSPSAEFHVACHGSGLSLYSTPRSMISITALAHAIKSDPTWNPGRTVWLLACEAGKPLPYGRSSFARPMCPAEELAKTLGCPVRAPTKLLWWTPPIDRWSLPELRILGPLGPPKPGLPNPNDPGDWVTYYPDM
jgi:RHS repeat-associated protein